MANQMTTIENVDTVDQLTSRRGLAKATVVAVAVAGFGTAALKGVLARKGDDDAASVSAERRRRRRRGNRRGRGGSGGSGGTGGSGASGGSGGSGGSGSGGSGDDD